MVGQTALLVPLATGEAVALAGVTAEAGFAVRGVFLAVGEGARAVDDGSAAAEVVRELDGDGRATVLGVGGAEADQRDPPGIVHDVDLVVLTHSRGGRRGGPAVMLEGAVDVVGDLDGTSLAADDLLHPQAGRVVQVLGVDGGFGARSLGRERLQPVGVVPREVP